MESIKNLVLIRPPNVGLILHNFTPSHTVFFGHRLDYSKGKKKVKQFIDMLRSPYENWEQFWTDMLRS
jgi:hypothetical protein